MVTWFIEDDTLGIREINAPDVNTRKNFWNFIQLHEGHRKYFKIPDYLPHEIQTYPYLKEPRIKKTEIYSNSMLRIVNIEKTLNKLIYPNISETLFINIKDGFCKWNSGMWSLKIQNTKGIVVKSDESIADITLDIKGLAQLIAGHRNTKELVEQNFIKGKQEFLDKLDLIFPKNWYVVRDFF